LNYQISSNSQEICSDS